MTGILPKTITAIDSLICSCFVPRVTIYDDHMKHRQGMYFGAISEEQAFNTAVTDCLKIIANWPGKRSDEEFNMALNCLDDMFDNKPPITTKTDAMRLALIQDDEYKGAARDRAWKPLAGYVLRGRQSPSR